MPLKLNLLFLFILLSISIVLVSGQEHEDPNHHVTIGPHTTRKPILTNPEYEKKLAEYKIKIDALQTSLTRMNTTLLSRIAGLEVGHYNVLADRVTKTEHDIAGMKTHIQHEVTALSETIDTKVNELGQRIETELGGFDGAINATRFQVHALESGKVQRLLNQNEIWRKNFKRLNVTINKLGKSRG